eukprot:jgi/Psemu1/1835/gm1.1835_g
MVLKEESRATGGRHILPSSLKLMRQQTFGSSWKRSKHSYRTLHTLVILGISTPSINMRDPDQFVTDFCHSSISDPILDNAVQLVLNKHWDMYKNFDTAVAHFTRTLGLKKIQSKCNGGRQNISAHNNANSSSDNNNGNNKKQKTSHKPTYTRSLEGKFCAREIWITMSAAQKTQVKSIIAAKQSPATQPKNTLGTNLGAMRIRRRASSRIDSLGRPVVCLKRLCQSSSISGHCEMKSHANTTAAGYNMVLLDPLDSVMTYADVAPFSDAYSPLKNVPIARCTTAWTDPMDGVEDIPQKYDSSSTHSITLCSDDTELLNPLQANGYGVCLPKSIVEAKATDLETGTNHWAQAIAKEMKNSSIAFEFNGEDKILVGHTKITMQTVFDHKVPEISKEYTYLSVPSQDSVQLFFLLAALNNLDALSADIQNAYLTAPIKKKYSTFATEEQEFSQELYGSSCKLVRALYQLPVAGVLF